MSPKAKAALKALLDDPQHADAIEPPDAAALMATLATIQAILASRLHPRASSSAQTPDPDDRLLAPVETAERLGVGVRWLYRHADQLPFTRRLSRKVLRFSENGLRRYLEGKKR
jgi:hypothetical protein